MDTTPRARNVSPPHQQQLRFPDGYDAWMAQQKADVLELQGALSSPAARRDVSLLRSLVDKCVQHYKDYIDLRRETMREDALLFFCPTWCSSLENSFLWMAGCRPTMQIRLLYVLSGIELETRLEEFLMGDRRGDLVEITARQMEKVNDLHCRTIRDEDHISRRMALLQEDVADSSVVPFSIKIKEEKTRDTGRSGPEGLIDSNSDAGIPRLAAMDAVVEPYLFSLAGIMEAADRLRVSTMKELVLDILTPLQAAEFIAAAKQLHMSLHHCGIDRDKASGRTLATDS